MELGVLYCPPSSRSRGLQPFLALILLPLVPLNSVLIACSQPAFSQVSCFTFSDTLSSSIGASQSYNFCFLAFVCHRSLVSGFWTLRGGLVVLRGLPPNKEWDHLSLDGGFQV